MADNVVADPGTGGATFKTDDDGTAHWPYSKMAWGADNTQTRVTTGAGAVPIQDGGNAITVDNGGTFAVQVDAAIPAGTNNIGDVDVASIAAGDNNIGNVDIVTFPAEAHSADYDSGAGTDTTLAFGIAVPASGGAAVITGDATNGLDVDVTRVGGTVTVDGSGVTQPVSAASLPLPTGASTSANQTTIIGHLDGVEGLLTTIDADTGSLAGTVSGTELQVDVVAALPAGTNNIGDVDVLTLPGSAHDAAISGNPVRVAGRAATADYMAVAAGDTADLLASILGKLVTLPYALPGASWSYASSAAVTDTADDVAKAASGAGVRNYITGVQVFNGHDTVGTEVVIKDGTTVLWRGWCEQTGGGAAAQFNPPLRGTANTAVNVANITTGSSTYFNLQGFTAAE